MIERHLAATVVCLAASLAACGRKAGGGTAEASPTPSATLPSAGVGNPAWDAEYPILGRRIHVATTGRDTGDGSEAAPLASIRSAIERANPGDAVVIHAGTYREWVRVSRSGAPGAPIIVKGEGEVVVEDPGLPVWSHLWDGVFTFESCSWLVVTGIVVRNSHWFGFAAYHGSHLVFQNLRTFNTGASGLYVRESDAVTVRGTEVRKACYQTRAATGGAGTQECISMASVEDFDVYGNEVLESGAFGDSSTGGEGIDAKEACRRGRIHGNRVHDLDRLGIYVDSWDALLEDVEVFGNRVWNTAAGFAVSSEAGGTARRVRIVNNVAFSNRESGAIVSTWGEPGRADGPREDVSIVNNTFYSNGTAIWGGGIEIQTKNARRLIVRNNICSRNTMWQISIVDPSVAVVDHNLIDGYRGHSWIRETRGEAFVEGDPLFVSPAGFDLHVKDGSPALDNGSADGVPGDDCEGTTRPRRSGFDIGAYEKP